MCMSEYLFKVQLKNRLQQKGLLKRFSIECFGIQNTLEDIRSEKSRIFKMLKDKKLKPGSKLYDTYFLRYIPNENKTKKNTTKKNTTKKKY